MQTQLTAGRPDSTAAAALQVRFVAGECYETAIRDHRILTDQPGGAGGADMAPTPVELFAASLAACVAFYAGRYLTRHGLSRDGLAVAADFEMAADRPARVSSVTLTVTVPPGLPESRRPALQAVVEHCTVHNTLTVPPEVTIALQ